MMIVEISSVHLEDMERLQAISQKTFAETFAAFNSSENMRLYAAKHFSVEKLSDEWRQLISKFFFATHLNRIIGYMKLNISDAQTEICDENSMEIERIYVLKEAQGNQVGQQLLHYAMQIAKQNQKEYIWLGVWEKNKQAIDFYLKNGFIIFDKHEFVLGDDRQTDWLMKLQLK